MRIVCWQMILMKYHTLFFSKIEKEVEKFVVCLGFKYKIAVIFLYIRFTDVLGAQILKVFVKQLCGLVLLNVIKSAIKCLGNLSVCFCYNVLKTKLDVSLPC